MLRERLDENAPAGRESMREFVRRLCGAAAWLHAHKREQLRFLCTNQKCRAADLLRLSGAKTKW